MVLSAKNTKRDAKRFNTQDWNKRRKARMTIIKLDVHRPFAHVGRIIVNAIESLGRSREGNSNKMHRIKEL